ncbi:MAG: hypothetical protein ACJ749_02550 [Flavisolibacter sp.]
MINDNKVKYEKVGDRYWVTSELDIDNEYSTFIDIPTFKESIGDLIALKHSPKYEVKYREYKKKKIEVPDGRIAVYNRNGYLHMVQPDDERYLKGRLIHMTEREALKRREMWKTRTLKRQYLKRKDNGKD